MTHIEQMIQDLCPNGVEWKTFDELGAFYGGLSGKTKDDFKEGNEKFITYLNIANNPALRLDIDETVKIGPNEKQNIVQYGDALFTGSSETPDECAMSSVVTEHPSEALYLNSFCFGFRFKSLDGIYPIFYKHYFRSEAFRKAVRRTANGTTRFNVSKKEFAKLSIPIPPMEIQKYIADFLDRFSALAAELQAELQARRKQYEYFRTHLLTPASESNSADKSDDCNWEWKTLGEIAEIDTGNKNRQDAVDDGEYPFYVRSKDVYRINSYSFDEEAIIIPGEGGIGDIFHYVNEKYDLHQRAYRVHFITSDINTKYAFYYLQVYFKDYIMNKAVAATVTSIRKPMLQGFPIAFPSLEEQERIVSILDKFEALTTSLSDGIPAEQAAQQKRYEYYRDKLLTFEKRP